MRLLSSESLNFVDFDEESPQTYAILSHRWYGDHEEVSYQEMCKGTGTRKRGFKKIKKCGEIAKYQGHPFFWVDTCCIDKSSSAELSEAINSMYLWYKNAAVCYAYISDVPVSSFKASKYPFERCSWFLRGWTLQELIAPKDVQFLSQEWNFLGSKDDLKDIIQEITGIPVSALQGEPLDRFTVAEKMSWASKRRTKRVEDRAYLLMGLFGVHMPLLYGEKEKAFLRLQEEIMKTLDDQSLFAWRDPKLNPKRYVGLLASSPDMFIESKNIHLMRFWHGGDAFTITNRGLRVRFFLIPLNEAEGIFRASLECWVRNSGNSSIAIYLQRLSGAKDDWGTSSKAQFTRIYGDRFDIITAEQKTTGIYREIYIRQNPVNPNYELLDPNNIGTWNFRINPTQIVSHLPWKIKSLTAFPPRCWDPQTRLFTTQSFGEKLGGICFDIHTNRFLVIFGISFGQPWTEVMSVQSPGQAWDLYVPTGREISRSTRPWTTSVTFSANITLAQMYGGLLYIIDTSLD